MPYQKRMDYFRDLRAVAASAPATFRDVLHYWADRTPDAPAVLTESGGAVSFADLATLTDEIGMALNARGFGRGDRIVLVHPGGAEMLKLGPQGSCCCREAV